MSTSLKEYLKKYESNALDEKKKKKKKKPKAVASGVLVVDEDPVWQKPVKLDEEEENDSPDEKPQVDEDIEVKRMKRLEQLRARRSYNEISEDGSGWVPITDALKSSTSFDPSSDISPPRNRKARNDTPSPMGDREVDLSPPRRRQHNDTPSPYPDGDLSPPRQRRQRNDTPSPGPDGDLSPPRQRRQRNGTPSPGHNGDLSPPRQRRQRNDTPSQVSDGDLLPPRPRKKLGDSSILKRSSKASEINMEVDLPRHRRQHYDSPLPERRTKALDAHEDSDMSPPRRRGCSGSLSPTPQKTSSVSEIKDADLDDLSPPRRQRSGSVKVKNSRDLDDLSPPRKSQKGSDTRDHRQNKVKSSDVDLSPPRKRKEQPKKGLITGKDVGEEIAKSKKDEMSRFNEMDPSTSGRGAEPVFRFKGARVSKDEYLRLTKKEEKTKEEKKLEWAKGLAQKREAEARLVELEREKEKPFARSRDDTELDRMMKDRIRWGDPMAHLVKKKQPDLVVSDFGDDEKMKESGFIVPQDIPSHSWLKRGLDYEPNRYGIKPGRHWDGVNRSNGYEKQMFKRMSEKRATEREAYLWSVSDM